MSSDLLGSVNNFSRNIFQFLSVTFLCCAMEISHRTLFSPPFTWVDNAFSIWLYRRRGFVCCLLPIPCSCDPCGEKRRACLQCPFSVSRMLTLLKNQRRYVTLKSNNSTNYINQCNFISTLYTADAILLLPLIQLLTKV